jgi:uncharacterized protein (TIGR02266 family)
LTCINLSEGGVYLRTLEPLPGGTVLHITFTLPHDTVPIKVAAEVVRSLGLGAQFEAEPGMGLHFIDIPEDTLLRIRNYVQWEMLGDLEWKSNIQNCMGGVKGVNESPSAPPHLLVAMSDRAAIALSSYD